MGFWLKYTMALLVPCTFFLFALLWAREEMATRKEPYLAMIFALLIFSPVILWNYLHDWVSFRMQLAHG